MESFEGCFALNWFYLWTNLKAEPRKYVGFIGKRVISMEIMKLNIFLHFDSFDSAENY